MGCLEAEIATSTGVGMVSIQDGSDGEPDGPFTIPAGIHAKIRAAIEACEPPSEKLKAAWARLEKEEVTFEDVVEMVRMGAKPRVQYFRLRGDDLVYGTDSKVMREEWLSSLACLPSDWDEWGKMDADMIMSRFEDFDIQVAPGPEGEFDEEDGEDY